MFLSRFQRPKEVIPGLQSKPVWDVKDLNIEALDRITKLKNSWQIILEEGLKIKGMFLNWREDEHLSWNGTWNYLQFITGKIRKGTAVL